MSHDMPKQLPACVSRRVLLSSGAVMSFATAMTLAGCSSSDTSEAKTTGSASAGAAATNGVTSTATATPSGESTTTKNADDTAANQGDATIPAGTKIMALADLPENTAQVVKVASVGVLIARETGDKILAFNAICTHKFLADVVVNGKVATCPAHDSDFNAFTGAVEKGPAETPLASITVKVDGENIVTA